MTNYEKIKTMTVEEMAYSMANADDILTAPCDARYCPSFDVTGLCPAHKVTECRKATINWLNAEVEA